MVDDWRDGERGFECKSGEPGSKVDLEKDDENGDEFGESDLSGNESDLLAGLGVVCCCCSMTSFWFLLSD